MTVPNTQLNTNWDQTLGVGSDLGRQEWNLMMQRRAQLVDSIEARWKMSSQLGGTPAAKQTADNLANRQQTLPDPDTDLEYRNQLLGAAHFYGITDADKIPLPALQHIIEAKRLTMNDGSEPLNPIQGVGQGAAALLAGGTQELVGLAQRLPFIGHTIAQAHATQAISQKIAELNEGVSTNLTPEDQQGYRMMHAAGGMLSYLLPASSAWRVAGALGEIAPIAAVGSRIGAIGRVGGAINAAIQGTATTAMLEGGGDPTSLPGKLAMGAAGGAAFHLAAPAIQGLMDGLPQIFSRVRSSFGTVADNIGAIPTDYAPVGGAGTVDADVIAAQRLGAGPRLLSGPVSTEPLPPESTVPQAPAGPQGMLTGRPGAPVSLDPARGLPSPVIPMGDGTIPAGRQLPAPYESQPGAPYSDQSRDLYSHYSNMAQGLAQTNPELAASMAQVAKEFAPPAMEFNSRAPFDPRSILTDREGYDPASVTQQPQSPNAMANIDAIQTGLANIKGGKGGGAPSVIEASASGANVTKQAAILESPVLGEMAAQPRFDDTDVAKSLMASNPGGIQTIQNIGDAGKTLRTMAQQQAAGRIMPHQFRIVAVDQADGSVRNDLLVTDGLPITNKRVEQYKSTGTFEGQRVTLAGGHEVSVVTPAAGNGFATVRTSGGLEMAVPAGDIMPGKTTDVMPQDLGIKDAQQFYNGFRNTVIQRNAQTNLDAGLPQFGWLDPQTSNMLPTDVEHYLDHAGITSPAARNAMKNFFDHQRVQDFQNTNPAELEQMRAVNRMASVRITEARARANLPATLDEMASTKNFRWENQPGTEGGDLVDIHSQTRFPMEHEDAARAFLKSNNREVPDVTPITDVPMEIMEAPAGGHNPGDATDPAVTTDHVVASHHFASDMIETHIAEMQQNMRDRAMAGPTPPPPFNPAFAREQFSLPRGGDGSIVAPPPGSPPPPTSPPLPPSGYDTPDGLPPLPPGDNSLGAQFARAKVEHPKELSEAMQEFDGLWLRFMQPFRATSMQLQNSFNELGIDQNRLFSSYNEIVTGKTIANNQANPYHREWNDIMSRFPARWVRDGTVAKIEELGDFNKKLAAMQRLGYTDAQVAAQGRIRDWFDRAGQEFGVKGYLFNYIPHIRMRAGMPGVNDPISGMLPKELDFFGDHMRQGGINLRQMDMNVLGHQYVRAVTFDRNVAPAWNEMRQSWNDDRIPEVARGMVDDWLQVARTGHNPGYSPMIQGVRQFMNTMGLPVTDHDISGMWSGVFRNMYRSFLGWNPAPIARDSIQPYLTGTKIGFQPINEAYAELLKGGQSAADMWKRGLEGGWVEKGAIRTANQDVFTGPAGLDAGGNSTLDPTLQRRRDAMANIADHMRDMLPRKFRHGVQGTAFDPLHGYAKLQEVNRVVSGEAGWRVASKAIADFRANSPDGFSGDMGKLMVDSKASAYDTPIRDRFIELIQQGDDGKAANFLANEAANLQFRGGIAEAPIGLRTPTGRAAMMLGNFTQGYIQTMKEGLGAGSIPDRIGFGLRHGIVMGALSLAEAKTGWKFSKWMWHSALSFSGGPLLRSAMEGADATAGVVSKLTGFRPTQDQADAVKSVFGNSNQPGFLQQMNPLNGLITAGTNLETYRGAGGWPAAARAVIMNQPGTGPNVQQWLQSLQYNPPGAGTIPPDNVRRQAQQPQQPTAPPIPGSGAMY